MAYRGYKLQIRITVNKLYLYKYADLHITYTDVNGLLAYSKLQRLRYEVRQSV